MITRAKLGILVTDLSASQSNFYAIMETAKRQDEQDFIFFYENLIRPMLLMPCATMQMNELWSFQGPVIATNLSTADKLTKATSPGPKFFYCQDLEWYRLPYKNYESLANIYKNPEIQLICRSREHKIIIEDCWNTPVNYVCDTWKEVLDEKRINPKENSEIPFLVYSGRKRVPEYSFL